ncbi:MAG: hypothetical protein KKF44_06205 [Nanoarchaeota archaeon]|nr:hypothetical protein [Nanoarchaeota archaeon]
MIIKKAFEDFLSEQKARLSPKTYSDYKSVIGLFEDSLDGYAWNNLDDCDNAYQDARKKNLSFIDIYDHSYIWENVGEFLDYFIPRKVNWGDEFVLKTCPRIIRKFLKWMRGKNLLDKTNVEIHQCCENQTWEDSLREMGFK